MPPKAIPKKNGSAQKSSPPKSATIRGVKGGTGKKAKEKQKKSKLKLKGRWLETKADWAKFDAWAEINAKPRKIVEPEPMVRATKPLSQMKKRIIVLSKPHKLSDISKTCRTDFRVSKKALTAKPSKRILQLAKFVMRDIELGREIPTKISRSALSYKPSKRIIEISQPQVLFLSDFCKFLVESQNVTSKEETNNSAKKRVALAKKLIQCPDLMTDEEMNILVTPTGVFRSALNYKVTPWINYLALPAYRFLKDQTHEKAEEWKKIIVEEGESRGKEALQYKKKKRQKEEKAEEPKEDRNEVEEMKEEDDKTDVQKQPVTEEVQEEDEDNVVQKEDQSSPEEDYKEPANETNEPADKKGDTEQDLPIDQKKNDKKSSKTARKAEVGDSKPKEETAEDEEAAKRRKEERNAWRFESSPCADNPFEIKRSALNGKVPPRMEELAKHRERKDRSCKMNAFKVRKSALDGPIPERVMELAKPNHPLDPVEKPPPRDKDPFGRPIFSIPPYGKKMPRVKPYQEAECPPKEEKVDDEEAKKKNESRKRKAINPIVFEPTIDPCIDPERAKKQLEARKAAKEEMSKDKKRKKTNEKSKEEDDTDAKDDKPQVEPDTDE